MLSPFSNKWHQEILTEKQQKDPIIKLVYQQVTAGKKPKTSAIINIKSKAVQKYLLQVNRLAHQKGGLHQLYIDNAAGDHQVVLPVKYQAQVLHLLMMAKVIHE